MEEHQTILRRMVVLANRLEKPLADQVDDFEADLKFIDEYVDEFHHLKEEEIYFKWMQEQDPFLLTDGPVLCMNKEHKIGRNLVQDTWKALAAYKNGDLSQESSVKSNLYQYIGFINDHIQKEDTALYQVAEQLNETAKSGDKDMLPQFEEMAAKYRDVMKAALDFEQRLVDETPAWLSPN